MTREEIYDLLITCLPSQLTAISVRLDLNSAYLPASNEAIAVRAEAILKLAEQKFGSLEILEEVLNRVFGRPVIKRSIPASLPVTEKRFLPATENQIDSSVNVFISYAHSSPDHKQTVYDLIEVLRLKGLNVLADTDVSTPQGPTEGWPKWMKSQLEKANWVLLYFDDVYRRRFDGVEKPGIGRGASWETTIIAHELYSAQAKNTRFIPLLPDGADDKLIPLELSGATFYRIPSQAKELAALLAQGGKPV